MEYWALGFGSFLLAGDFVMNKIYQRRYGTQVKTAFLFNSLVGLFTAVIFFLLNGCQLTFSLFSLLMAGIYSVLIMTYSMIGFQLLKTGTMAMYTLVLMAGGMVLPYIFGVVFLNEPLRHLRTIGLLVILMGVALPNFGKEKLKKKQILMLAAVFGLNGCVSITSKLHQINGISAVSTADFIIWQGIIKFLLAGFIFLKAKDSGGEIGRSSWKSIAMITGGSAALSGSFTLIQLNVAATLPASILYPFNTGLTVILSSVLGVLFFKEKLSSKLVIGILLCFVGTLMFL